MNINEVVEQIKLYREELLKMIDQIPDAQTGVNQISKKPEIAIVNLSHVQKNKGILCPHYYLNGRAKEALRKLVQRSLIEDLPKRIKNIIQSGQIKIKSKDAIKLNPEFISILKDMWKGILNDS